MNSWGLSTVGEFAPFFYGKGLPLPKRKGGQIPVVGSGGVSGWHDEPLISGPVVVIGRKGTVGSVQWFSDGAYPIDTTFYVKPGENHDLKFTYYLLQTLGLEKMSSDSAVPGLNRDRAHTVQVRVPPLAEQRRIAGVLGALDDLIDTNDKLAARCKNLRSAIVSEALNNAPDSAPLTDFANFVNGKNFTKHAAGTGTPIIRTPEVRNGVAASTPRSPVAADKSNIAQNGDTLLVWSGSLMVSRWVGEDALINQHIFKVIPTQAPDWLVHGLVEFQMDWFLGLAADKATTMGHIQRGHLDAPVPKLAENVITQLGVQVVPLWDSEIELKVENESLRRVRDELLPLLMSGKIRVREAEEVVASVTKGDG